jgi:hypothetical protein
MQATPSADPCDQVIGAALQDVAALASIVAGEFHATSLGSDRARYLYVLGDYLADLGGQIAQGPTGPVVAVDDRQIAPRFDPSSGRR